MRSKHWKLRAKQLLALFGMCLMLVCFGFIAGTINGNIVRLEQEIELLHHENQARELQLDISRQLLQEVLRLRAENEELHRRMQDWLDAWEVDVWESTAYAPLDPRAREGMCYSGNPRITASGAEVIPYLTAAAGPGIKLNTPVYVVGQGPRVVQDRGRRVGDKDIDLAVTTKEEALKYGRQPVKVVYQREGI